MGPDEGSLHAGTIDSSMSRVASLIWQALPPSLLPPAFATLPSSDWGASPSYDLGFHIRAVSGQGYYAGRRSGTPGSMLSGPASRDGKGSSSHSCALFWHTRSLCLWDVEQASLESAGLHLTCLVCPVKFSSLTVASPESQQYGVERSGFTATSPSFPVTRYMELCLQRICSLHSPGNGRARPANNRRRPAALDAAGSPWSRSRPIDMFRRSRRPPRPLIGSRRATPMFARAHLFCFPDSSPHLFPLLLFSALPSTFSAAGEAVTRCRGGVTVAAVAARPASPSAHIESATFLLAAGFDDGG